MRSKGEHVHDWEFGGENGFICTYCGLTVKEIDKQRNWALPYFSDFNEKPPKPKKLSTNKRKPSKEWEKRYKKLFDVPPAFFDYRLGIVFIRQLLTQQKQDLLQEIEEELKKLQKTKEYCGCHSEAEILAERIKKRLNEYI